MGNLLKPASQVTLVTGRQAQVQALADMGITTLGIVGMRRILAAVARGQ